MVGEVVAWSVVMSDDESGVSLSWRQAMSAYLGGLGREGAPRTPLRESPYDPLLEPLGR